ncbi:multidrug efflux system outer membrane protein [Duganella sp. 3397]|uniref:efflux transporter outer membrane subunit n=1 Tax=Duganella sp. 3397 TaxID=2817732 RepID=UPI00285CBF25|nr:efflux transporter outer membrane subunit [Duganella sp. 3397]MDR7051317.1 multidrug efflux system outer membrane protein [Duganella sp. 3397]
MKKSLLTMAALLLAGCAAIPPDAHIAAQRDITTADLTADIHLAREGWPQARWWTAYGDAQLNALVEQALQGGPSLEVAAARIGSARSELSRSMADMGIDISGYANANRQRYSGTGLFPAPIGGAYFTTETLRLEARYNFDWWGKNRAQVAAAVGALNVDRAAYAQAEQALAAAIAQSYFRLQGDFARLDNLARMTAAQTALAQDRNRRIDSGLASADASHAAQAELAQLRKHTAQLNTDIGVEREALRALLGADHAALADLKPVQAKAVAHALPARLGIDLLARRPDLQAARWKVESSLSRIDAAKAAFYPDVNLTGSIGLDTIKVENLLQAASRTVYLGPTLSLPIFDSRRLDAQLDATRTARNERIAEYNQAVVDAVREVAQDALQVQGIEQQIAEQAASSKATAAQLASAQKRYERGLADNAAVLHAQLAVLRERDADLTLQQVQRLAEVALTNALGGGYHEQAPLATAMKQVLK